MGSSCIFSQEKHEDLYILSPYFNPSRNSRRKTLHTEFLNRMSKFSGIKIITIECVLDNDLFEFFSSSKKEITIHIRAKSTLWIKENLINIGLQHLQKNMEFKKYCRYVAWIDDDIEFVDSTWVLKLKKSLLKFEIVQIFKNAWFMDESETTIETHTSFGYFFTTRKDFQLNKNEYPHPGYAWCTKKRNLLKIGCLFDYGILGNGDKHMAYAIIGKYLKSFPEKLRFHDNYKNLLKKWQDKAIEAFQKKLGFVDVTIKHHWHGSRENRQHQYRWILLSSFWYDPEKDVERMEDGHFELKNQLLENKIKEYFRDRKEDEILFEGIPDEFPKKLISKNRNIHLEFKDSSNDQKNKSSIIGKGNASKGLPNKLIENQISKGNISKSQKEVSINRSHVDGEIGSKELIINDQTKPNQKKTSQSKKLIPSLNDKKISRESQKSIFTPLKLQNSFQSEIKISVPKKDSDRESFVKAEADFLKRDKIAPPKKSEYLILSIFDYNKGSLRNPFFSSIFLSLKFKILNLFLFFRSFIDFIKNISLYFAFELVKYKNFFSVT